jgi:hypothetical protein
MDAPVQKPKAFVAWRPEIRPYGSVEIGVERWNDDVQRYVLDSVSLKDYVRMWTDEALKFQGKYGGKVFKKPEHYPTLEQVAEYLEYKAKLGNAQEEVTFANPSPRPRARFVPPPVDHDDDDEEEAEPPPSRPKPSIKWAEHATKKSAAAKTPAPKAPEPKPEQPPTYKFRPAVDPVVFQQYRLAASAIKTREGVVTREALAEVLLLPPETVDDFLDVRLDFEAELGIAPKTKQEKTKNLNDISVSAAKSQTSKKKSGSKALPDNSAKVEYGIGTEEKRKAFSQASADLWAIQKPTPLRTVDLVRKAHTLLGKDRIAEGSLNTQLYALFSEAQRKAWLDPRQNKKPK